MTTIEKITEGHNEMLNNIFSDQDKFMSIYSEVIESVLPNDLLDELKNSSKEEKSTLVKFIIQSVCFEHGLNKAFNS